LQIVREKVSSINIVGSLWDAVSFTICTTGNERDTRGNGDLALRHVDGLVAYATTGARHLDSLANDVIPLRNDDHIYNLKGQKRQNTSMNSLWH
jgi:hypothetical protein